MMNGKKTYITGIATIIFAAGGWLLGHLSAEQAAQLISTSLLAMGLRHGISTSQGGSNAS